MYLYANEFSVAFNAETKELVLVFRQTVPNVERDGNISQGQAETVSSLIVPEPCALALRDALNNLPHSEE